MPETRVLFYKNARTGRVPVVEWLDELARRDPEANKRCCDRIDRLRELGHQLRRPEADYLEEGIYELRIRLGRVNYRMLYFFHGQNVTILAHALSKEGKVPVADVERALKRRTAFISDPDAHTYPGEDDG